jgi:hypothetical protein
VQGNRRATTQELTNALSSVNSLHRDTVKKVLYRLGYASRIAAKKPYLKPEHMVARLAFAKTVPALDKGAMVR